MIAQISQPSRPKAKSQTNAKRAELKLRTREVLAREIAFIPNPGFQEMDIDEAWRQESADADVATATESSIGRSKMPAHLDQLCATPLLEPKEERALFCRMNYLKFRANVLRATLNATRPSVRKLEEIERLLATAEQLRNRIVNANTRLVVSIVRKFADEKNPFDDLLSEGISCLIKTVEKFDFDRGFRFSTYATLAIRREVFRLIKRTHRDRTRFSTGATEVLDQQVNEDAPSERTESALTQLNGCVTKVLCHLDEREQFIVKARYGLIELDSKPSFSNLGKELGVSKERVRQLEMRAMKKLREAIDELRLAELESLL